jgi:hypothetical protein
MDKDISFQPAGRGRDPLDDLGGKKRMKDILKPGND